MRNPISCSRSSIALAAAGGCDSSDPSSEPGGPAPTTTRPGARGFAVHETSRIDLRDGAVRPDAA